MDASLPIETVRALRVVDHIVLDGPQPLAQFGPIRPGWSAVGGVQGQAACASSKPRTVM